MKFVLPTINEWHSLHPEQTRVSSSNFSFILDYLPILTGYRVKKKRKRKKEGDCYSQTWNGVNTDLLVTRQQFLSQSLHYEHCLQ